VATKAPELRSFLIDRIGAQHCQRQIARQRLSSSVSSQRWLTSSEQARSAVLRQP
jgi:hypothetical protein